MGQYFMTIEEPKFETFCKNCNLGQETSFDLAFLYFSLHKKYSVLAEVKRQEVEVLVNKHKPYSILPLKCCLEFCVLAVAAYILIFECF